MKALLEALSEACRAATHDLTLADELGIEFTAVEGKENVEIDACENCE